MASYSFLTTWILDASREDVWQAIYEVERWPEWWRGVRSVEQLEQGDADGIGALYRHEWRSVIPYPVRFESRITRIDPGTLIEATAEGELAGIGRWRLFAQRWAASSQGSCEQQRRTKCGDSSEGRRAGYRGADQRGP